jgi:hypothetical protein
VAFRRVTDAEWSRGATLDISRSGVLFVPAAGAAPDGDLLMVVFLSRVTRRADAAPMADLHCGGRIARVTATPGGERALAMQIEFEWAEKPPDSVWGPSCD